MGMEENSKAQRSPPYKLVKLTEQHTEPGHLRSAVRRAQGIQTMPRGTVTRLSLHLFGLSKEDGDGGTWDIFISGGQSGNGGLPNRQQNSISAS